MVSVEQLKILKNMSDKVVEMVSELEKLLTHQMVGKLYRLVVCGRLEAVEVYKVDEVEKIVFVEFTPKCATGREMLKDVLEQLPGYNFTIKARKPEPEIANLLGKPFKTPVHTLVFVHAVDFNSKVVYVTPVSGMPAGMVEDLPTVLQRDFPQYTWFVVPTDKENLTFSYSGGVLCLKHRKQ